MSPELRLLRPRARGPAGPQPAPRPVSERVPRAARAGGSGIVAGTAVYYVAVDDGGSSGVRFGCNDSLVAVRHADPAIREPLQAAMGHLLSGSAPPAGLYNALASSALKYVSGYLDGRRGGEPERRGSARRRVRHSAD